jgi:hypothetical protein
MASITSIPDHLLIPSQTPAFGAAQMAGFGTVMSKIFNLSMDYCAFGAS